MSTMTYIASGSLASVGTISLLRKLPVFKDLFLEGKKPIACNVCMAFWASFLINAISFFSESDKTLWTLYPNPVSAEGQHVVVLFGICIAAMAGLSILAMEWIDRRPIPPIPPARVVSSHGVVSGVLQLPEDK